MGKRLRRVAALVALWSVIGPSFAGAQFDPIEKCYDIYDLQANACYMSARADLFEIAGEVGLACAPLILTLNLAALLFCLAVIVVDTALVIATYLAYEACLVAASAQLDACLECA